MHGAWMACAGTLRSYVDIRAGGASDSPHDDILPMVAQGVAQWCIPDRCINLKLRHSFDQDGAHRTASPGCRAERPRPPRGRARSTATVRRSRPKATEGDGTIRPFVSVHFVAGRRRRQHGRHALRLPRRRIPEDSADRVHWGRIVNDLHPRAHVIPSRQPVPDGRYDENERSWPQPGPGCVVSATLPVPTFQPDHDRFTGNLRERGTPARDPPYRRRCDRHHQGVLRICSRSWTMSGGGAFASRRHSRHRPVRPYPLPRRQLRGRVVDA